MPYSTEAQCNIGGSGRRRCVFAGSVAKGRVAVFGRGHGSGGSGGAGSGAGCGWFDMVFSKRSAWSSGNAFAFCSGGRVGTVFSRLSASSSDSAAAFRSQMVRRSRYVYLCRPRSGSSQRSGGKGRKGGNGSDSGSSSRSLLVTASCRSRCLSASVSCSFLLARSRSLQLGSSVAYGRSGPFCSVVGVSSRPGAGRSSA